MMPGAQQPISALAVGDSAVTPSSILDNGRHCENAAALRAIKMAMNRTKQKPFHLSTRSCFSGIHTKQFMPDEIVVIWDTIKIGPQKSEGAGCRDQVVRRTTNINNLVCPAENPLVPG